MKHLLLLLALITGPVWAGQAILTSTAPTLNVDDTDITEIPLQICYWRSLTAGDYATPADKQCVTPVAPGATSSYTFDNLLVGDHYFVATAIDSGDDESAFSGEVTKTIVDTQPIPPGGTALAGEKAYIIITSENALVLLDIGTVTADVVCSASVGMRDDNDVLAYKIPRTSVTPYNPGQELIAVFAACGN